MNAIRQFINWLGSILKAIWLRLKALGISIFELLFRMTLKTPDFLRNVGNKLMYLAVLCFVSQAMWTDFFAMVAGFKLVPAPWLAWITQGLGFMAAGGKLFIHTFYDDTKISPRDRAILAELKTMRKHPETVKLTGLPG